MLYSRTHLDIMQDNASTSLVLERQEFLSVFTLLIAVLFKEMREAIQGHIIPGEVESLEGKTHNYEATRGGKQLMQSSLRSGTDE